MPDHPTDTTAAIRAYLARLDLEPKIADIYLALHAFGAQSIVQLARNTSIERTRVYRLLETMKEVGLVEIEVRYKRSLVKAAPIGNLQVLLSRREQELHGLHHDLHALEQVFQPNTMESPLTKVQFYQGIDGIRQMLWNQTRAKTELVSLLYENMQSKTGPVYFERWIRECNKQNLHSRSIVGQHFMELQQQWYATHQNERFENWEGRYIDLKTFAITHSVVVYDDVTAYHNWKGDEVFGIELRNSEIAAAQRSIFEMLWAQSVPLNKTDWLLED